VWLNMASSRRHFSLAVSWRTLSRFLVLAAAAFLPSWAAATKKDAVKLSCASPPFCHEWWLSAESSLGVLGVVLLAIFGVGMAALLVLIVCTGLVVGCRCCYSLFNGSRRRASASGQYKLVSQRMDLDLDANNDVKWGGAPRGGTRHVWYLYWCCAGAVAALLSVGIAGTGVVFWWRLSGSPPLQRLQPLPGIFSAPQSGLEQKTDHSHHPHASADHRRKKDKGANDDEGS